MTLWLVLKFQTSLIGMFEECLLIVVTVALYQNVFQSQDERPLQKLPTLSLAELMTVFSSGFVLWCDCHTLFKPAPSARQASTSENDDKFSLRILTPFSSSGLAFWCAYRTLFLY